MIDADHVEATIRTPLIVRPIMSDRSSTKATTLVVAGSWLATSRAAIAENPLAPTMITLFRNLSGAE